MPPVDAADPGEFGAADVAACLRRPTADDDKYRRGVVGMRTGSAAYPGAAVLGVEGAWRTGAGMVRYLGPDRASELVLQRRPETVTADGRVQAWVIGSGTDPSERSDAETAALRAVLARDVPVVVDAGALDLVAGAAAPVVVTPHASELAKLRSLLGLDEGGEDRVADARETAAALGGTVLSKGSPTLVATPAGEVYRVASQTHWLATAGTGDVLAGVVGAVIAGASEPVDPARLGALAATGAWLHTRAGALAAHAVGDGPIVALDVAEALPRAVASALG